MLKLVIVDDEADIREGLSLYPWADIGLQLSCVCQHGMEALKWMEEHPVDLLITDIRMPIMDGLELVRRVRAHFPYIKVVVLSGYEDFAYAQTCIQYGVSKYLLKPIDPALLFEAIKELQAQQKLEYEKLEQNRLLERRSNQLVKGLRREFLERLLSKPLSNFEIEDGCSLSEMILDGDNYVVALIRLDQAHMHKAHYAEEEWNLILFAFNNILTEVWEDEGLGYHYVDRRSGNGYLITTLREQLEDDLQRIRKLLYRFRGLFRSTISIIVGTPAPSVSSLHSSRLKADHVASQLAEGSFEIIHFDPLTYSQGKSAMQGKTVSDSSMTIINKAKQYIFNHYSRSLTLSEVAEATFVNSSYLSHLFTEATGNTFVHYLSRCRIEKAKEMLEHSNLKIYEVGEMVGYQNPRYFSSIFRKLTGVTPNEYRTHKG